MFKNLFLIKEKSALSMRFIGFDKKCSLLIQEAHLAKNTLLSGFDLLLKANYLQDKDGYFYSAFFHISVGIERILKLVYVTDFMLKNDYQSPSLTVLKSHFNHKIGVLYSRAIDLIPDYLGHNHILAKNSKNDESLIDFITEYAKDSRYFNLNKVCEEKIDRSPLDKWYDIVLAIYEEYTTYHVMQKSADSLMCQMERNGLHNGFTYNLDEHGHPLTVFDCLYKQYVTEKSSPLIIWRLIHILKPIHLLLEAMSYKATEYDVEHNISSMVIPHYEDFFYFLLSEKSTIKRRKKWLDTFQK